MRRVNTPEVDSARLKVGRKYTCSIASDILINLLAYELVFDSTVDEI